MYASTKTFTYTFSRSLQQLYGKKIDVMTVVPSSTKGGIIPPGNAYFGSITPDQHAKATIDALGQREETRGHVIHAIMPRIKQIPPFGLLIGLYNLQVVKRQVKAD